MKTQRGFTLIELVVYMAITTVLLTLVVTLYISADKAQRKEQAISAVETGGAEAMNTMLQTIRNAQSITTPSLGSSAASITLVTYASSTSPTTFTLSKSALQMTEGSVAAVPLTNSRLIITNFSIQNLGVTGTYGSLRVQFTASYATTTGAFDTTYSKTFYGSATVRRITQ